MARDQWGPNLSQNIFDRTSPPLPSKSPAGEQNYTERVSGNAKGIKGEVNVITASKLIYAYVRTLSVAKRLLFPLMSQSGTTQHSGTRNETFWLPCNPD